MDEGTILAVRDSDPVDVAAYTHLQECATCLAEVEDARARSFAVEDALGALDEPLDVAPARSAVRARLDRARIVHPLPAWRRWPLGRAALILLATAGAASALTWSPLRSWWGSSPPAPVPAAVEAPAIAQEATPGAISVEVPDAGIHVIVRGAEPGAVIEVVWVGGSGARVAAAAGSAFAYADGRIEVDAAPGLVRVELPRGGALVRLEVDGLTWLERSASGLAVAGPATARTDDVIRFVVPGR